MLYQVPLFKNDSPVDICHLLLHHVYSIVELFYFPLNVFLGALLLGQLHLQVVLLLLKVLKLNVLLHFRNI